eukprot:756697-Hanusia_phi.AAC.4
MADTCCRRARMIGRREEKRTLSRPSAQSMQTNLRRVHKIGGGSGGGEVGLSIVNSRDETRDSSRDGSPLTSQSNISIAAKVAASLSSKCSDENRQLSDKLSVLQARARAMTSVKCQGQEGERA